MKKMTEADRKKLRHLYVYLGKYDNKQINDNIQRQIDEIKGKYK